MNTLQENCVDRDTITTPWSTRRLLETSLGGLEVYNRHSHGGKGSDNATNVLIRASRSNCFVKQMRSGGAGQLVLCLFMVISLFSSLPVTAAHGSHHRPDVVMRLSEHGGILFDESLPPPPPMVYLAKRQGGSPFDSSDDSSGSTSTTASSTSTPSVTTTAAATSSTTSLSSPLPSPFDTSLGNNFTSINCPNFFNSFLSNATFTSCLPLSLLLQNSNSFFKAEQSMDTITTTLDATCNVDLSTCSSLMSYLGNQLRSDSNCGQDFRNQNPVVTQAYNGFLAYDPLYHAGCLKDVNGNYCYADAITNISSPADAYTYYLPLGIPLPGGSRPTCNSCLQNTMAILANYASNSTQPISTDYVNAAQQIDLGCGPNFINTTVPVLKSSGSSVLGSVRGLTVAVAVCVTAMLL